MQQCSHDPGPEREPELLGCDPYAAERGLAIHAGMGTVFLRCIGQHRVREELHPAKSDPEDDEAQQHDGHIGRRCVGQGQQGGTGVEVAGPEVGGTLGEPASGHYPRRQRDQRRGGDTKEENAGRLRRPLQHVRDEVRQ